MRKLLFAVIACCLLWGCKSMAHGPDERVVFLDGSEQFVGIDPVRLNGAFNYKAVTINQDVADAIVTAFTWRGGTVRPLAPVNLRGRRNSDGDLLIEWTRRSRSGQGMKPMADVPIGEENELYSVEIYDGADVVRTMPVAVGAAQAAILSGEVVGGPNAGDDVVSGNNVIEPPADGLSSSNAHSLQTLSGDGSWVEATLVTTAVDSGSVFLGVQTPEAASHPATHGGGVFSVDFRQNAAGSTFLVIRASGVTLYTSGALAGSPTSVRIRIAFSGSEIRFYRDYTGPGSIPLTVSSAAVLGFDFPPPYAVVIVANQLTRADDIFLRGNSTSTIYSAAQQTADFGSPQSSIKTRCYQVSAVVGRGAGIEANL